MKGQKARAARSDRRAPRPSAPARRHFPVLWRAVFTPLLAVPILLAGTGRAPAPSSLVSATSYLYPSFGSSGEDLLSPNGTSEPQAQAQAITQVPACPSSGTCTWSGIQNDVVAAGYESTGSSNGSQLAIGVVNPANGAKASSFDSGNLLTDSVDLGPTATVQATGVAVYPSCPTNETSCPWKSQAGDVVVTGTEEASASEQVDIFVAAYSPTTAGSSLWHADITPSGGIADQGSSLALDTTGSSPTGDIIVAGTVFPHGGGPPEPVVAALSPTGLGAFDSSFGVGGEEVGDIDPGSATPQQESLSSVVVDRSGNIVLAGTWSNSGGTESVVVARLLPAGATSGCAAAPSCSGALDDRFGGSSCATTATCSGATLVGSPGYNLVGAGAALDNLSGTCSGEPSCYDVLVAGTDSPTGSTGGNSLVAVAAVTQAGAKATGFGGGVVKLPAQSTNATGTGIAVQSTNGTITGVLVSGYTAGSTSTNGQATVSRISGTGSVLTSFGSNGTYVVPSRTSQFLPPALGLAVTWVPNSLDFMMAGALLASSDTQPRFALARVIGEVVAMSVSVTRDTQAANTDYVTVKLTAPAAAPSSISIKYSLRGTGGLTFSPSSGTINIAKGATTASARAVVYFPPLVGTQTVYVNTTNGSGLTAVTSPTAAAQGADSPFGTAPKPGYWLINKLGSVSSFEVPFRGGASHPKSPIVGAATNGTGSGYWMVSAAGGVYAFDVPYRGGYPGTSPSPIVAIAADPATTAGYWIFSRAGNVYAFGGAKNYGQGSHLNGPVVSAASAPDGLGYWLVTSTGAVYGYGPGAKYHGGASHPAAPIVSMAADLHTGGYWLVTAKGVVYGLGAPNYGSATGQNATSISPDPATNGYWVLLSNGGVYSFSAKYYGSAAPYHPNSALISIVGR